MPSLVQILPSGRAFEAEPGETLLAAALRQGVALPHGCRNGTCGACRCRRLSGEVRHGPHTERAMSPADEAAGAVLPCNAYALGPLVLEAPQVGAEDALPVRRLPARVTAMERVSPDVMILRLGVPGSGLPCRAGQHVDVLLRDGQRRSYSLANAPCTQAASPQLELHLRHLPGGLFTDQVFATLQPRELLRIEGPYGSFYLRESDKPLVLLASGTGFAPIKALIEQMRHDGVHRPATLYWGGRRPRDLYLHDWVLAQCAELPWLRFVPVVSDALPEDGWTGRGGFVHRAVLHDHPDLSGHQVYACGAPVVVDAARGDFTALAGLPAHEFYADAFTSRADRPG